MGSFQSMRFSFRNLILLLCAVERVFLTVGGFSELDSALFRGVKERWTIADITGLFRNLPLCLFFEVDILRFPRYNIAYRFIFIHPETSGAKA